MNRQRVLLTGATGRLGSAIHEGLSDTWDIIPSSRTGARSTLKYDLLSSSDIAALLEHDFQLVVNTAAAATPSFCRSNPDIAWRLNTVWPVMLAAYCREKGIPLVHFSSDLVYSGGTPPYTEASAAVPMSLYGWTKLVADILVLKKNPESLIIRTSVLCGETSSERKTFSQDILSGKVTRVFVDSWRNHTPIHWLAGILPELVSKKASGLVIASGKYSQSRSAYAEALLEKHGRSTAHLIQEYSPPGIPSRLHLRGSCHTSSVYCTKGEK